MSTSPRSTTAASLMQRLALIHEWYGRMVDAETGRLEYLYLPAADEFVRETSVIRDIASVWDVELLEDFLGRDELRPVVEASPTESISAPCRTTARNCTPAKRCWR